MSYPLRLRRVSDACCDFIHENSFLSILPGAPSGQLPFSQFLDDLSCPRCFQEFSPGDGEILFQFRDLLNQHDNLEVQVTDKAPLVSDVLHIERAGEFPGAKSAVLRGDSGLGILYLRHNRLNFLLDFRHLPLLVLFQLKTVSKEGFKSELKCRHRSFSLLPGCRLRCLCLAALLFDLPALAVNGIMDFRKFGPGLFERHRGIGGLLHEIHHLCIHTDR